MSGQRLAAMADQIARNFAIAGEAAAAEATARHIRTFWSPRMIADFARCDAEALSPAARLAQAQVRGDGGG